MDNIPIILLVEDEHLIRGPLMDALEEGGFTVEEAEDGTTAMGLIDTHDSLAAVVTDVRLGAGPSGWDVARHARHTFPKLAVVYMTGDSAAYWTAEGVPNSILLQKPFATAQLITAVSTLLNVVDVSPTQIDPAND